MSPEELPAPRVAVLVLAPSFEPAVKAGGPVRALANLVREVSATAGVLVLAPDRDLGDEEPYPGLSNARVRWGGAVVHYIDVGSTRHLLMAYWRLSRTAFDVVVVNSVWNVRMAFLPVVLRLLGVLRTRVLVVMPRGELEAGALALKSRKKASARPLVRMVYARAVDVFGATSESEAANTQLLVRTKPVLLTCDTPDEIALGFPRHGSNETWLAFLGRIHPTKGLLPLLKALSVVPSRVRLSIAGPIDDSDYWNQCQDVISVLPENVDVRFVGALSRDEIPPFLWEHDMLVNLTAGENFGHTFAEALQAGCPILATTGTPWTDYLISGGGWVLLDRDDKATVSEAITRYAALGEEDRLQARRRARDAYESWWQSRPMNIVELCLGGLLSHDGSQ